MTAFEAPLLIRWRANINVERWALETQSALSCRLGATVYTRLGLLGPTVPSSMSLRQEPKSASRMWPFTSIRMLSGLMSLKISGDTTLMEPTASVWGGVLE